MKHIIFIFILATSIAKSYAQLPLNTCGVVYTYDAAGNRTQRVYLCNNGTRAETVTQNKDEAIQVTALYPNPTTGQFRVTFTKALQHAQVIFIDMGGHVMQQRSVSGNLLDFDISTFPAGVYWIKIADGDNRLVYKVIKQ
jgi:hypothetical protein